MTYMLNLMMSFQMLKYPFFTQCSVVLGILST